MSAHDLFPEHPAVAADVVRPTPIPDPAPPAVVLPSGLPDVASVQLPDGRIVTGYTLAPATPPPAPEAPRPVPRWAKTTALLAPTVGLGIGAAGIGLSLAVPGLLAITNALWAAVALVAAGAVGAVAWSVRRSGSGPVHVTQHIHSRGMFGRASGTVNHR
ncbi:hypothetical protein BIV57_08845 [Mangrovactinospora gilvigrisea]|uniref:Uncharacterized protein n=1 Tax=Mangrovactinospora gilvigrisea TaxID=1428644 RepID=A0A1J7CDW5_9ACTN|nr:hypothetical protein [Mangrovactinospora gilvigrisea]OIV37858.1 hypothetical protein BIV57_08845 [Mangrovactinospora gilvigrisea]